MNASVRRRPQCNTPLVSRRHFLRVTSAAVAGVLAAGCQPEALTQIIKQAPGGATTSPARARVALAQATSYDREVVRRQVRALLDGVGGLDNVVSSGDRVAIKVNLTGGVKVKPLPGVSPIESYITHPEVVRALGEAVREAGARELFIVEAVYEWESYRLWGYEEVAKDLDATLIDLNSPQPYSGFATTPVGDNWFIYENFTFNPILEEIDVFMSMAKMKCHYSAGVTHSMKNLIGLVPAAHYRLDPSHNYRSAFHGPGDAFKTRLPRVILDLNRARPIHFALIDGIKTTEAGEGPWIETMAPVEPGVLVAGINPLATDAVATAVQGFDPTAQSPSVPFHRGDNYLNLARELGLGTNRLEEIEVVGASIEDVRYQFRPA